MRSWGRVPIQRDRGPRTKRRSGHRQAQGADAAQGEASAEPAMPTSGSHTLSLRSHGKRRPLFRSAGWGMLLRQCWQTNVTRKHRPPFRAENLRPREIAVRHQEAVEARWEPGAGVRTHTPLLLPVLFCSFCQQSVWRAPGTSSPCRFPHTQSRGSWNPHCGLREEHSSSCDGGGRPQGWTCGKS